MHLCDYTAAQIYSELHILRRTAREKHPMLQTGETDAVELRRREEARRLAAARRRKEEMAYYSRGADTADGRPHKEVQTELYLEELTDHVEEMDASCQTDAFLDRPPSPLFIPAKTGLDATTQVYDGDVGV